MTKNIPIIFFGSDIFVLPILEKLYEHYTIPLVLTTEKILTDPISSFATNHNLTLISVTKFTPEIITAIKNTDVDVAVLAFFGLILPQSVLELFPKGIINIHPSLLPKFRGPTPVQSAMLANEKETGVSIMKLDTQVDHGPLLAQETEPILKQDTDETLHKRLFEKGANLLIKTLPDYLNDSLSTTPQDHSNASFTTRLSRKSGYFDSNTPPPLEKLLLMIRAYYPWPGVWTTVKIKDHELRIKLLPNNMLQVEGKRPMSYKDFLNGYPENRAWLETLGVV